jgi:ParB/RepB/Spo0J family partition protein
MTAPKLDPLAGIAVPQQIVKLLVPIEEVVPNTWNPNSMDSFMRDKLVKAIRKDGFVLPVLVRPAPEGSASKWEIVDGEHRWRVASEELQMKAIPVLNLGAISDAEAKALTIKANTLRGEFDSVKLAQMVGDLVKEYGKENVIDSLPYTGERIESMMDLINTNLDELKLSEPEKSQAPGDSGDAGAGKGDEFKSFSPSDSKLDHKCPRCGFEFNDPKAA